eukprot:jgi/Tetstr1/426893/TSEL_017106.t1
MESDDPVVAVMHLAYAATFDPSVYVRCAPRAGCPRSGHHVFHGARAAARAATCEFCSPPPPTAPPPGVALPASAAGVWALQRHAASAAHDAALAATARWCATSDVYRMMPRTPLRDGVPPAVADAHRRAAKLTAVQELRRARHPLDTADLGIVSDAAAALMSLKASIRLLLPPTRSTPLSRTRRTCGGRRRRGVAMRTRDLDAPSWRMWVNRFLAGRCHSRTAAFLASGTVFALHKDDPAVREERAKAGEPL